MLQNFFFINFFADSTLIGTFSSSSSLLSLEWGGFGAYNLTQVQKQDIRPICVDNNTSIENNHLYEPTMGRSALESIDLDSDLLKLKPPIS